MSCWWGIVALAVANIATVAVIVWLRPWHDDDKEQRDLIGD
jgi:hypothetical protein